jgi:hypothetical protein
MKSLESRRNKRVSFYRDYHSELGEVPPWSFLVLKQKNEWRKIRENLEKKKEISWKPRVFRVKKVEAFPREKVIKVLGKTLKYESVINNPIESSRQTRVVNFRSRFSAEFPFKSCWLIENL